MDRPQPVGWTLGLALLDGLLGAVVGLLAAGSGARSLAEQVGLAPAWAPTFAWLVTSLGFALALGLALVRLRSPDALSPSATVARTAGVLLGSGVVSTCAACALLLREPTLVVLFGVWGAMALAAVWVGLGPAEKSLRRAGFAAVWLVAFASLPFGVWPLRVTLALSRPSLDALADRVAAGQPLRAPERAGLFWIQDADLRDDLVFLVTAPDPGGPTGFTRAGERRKRISEWWGYSLGGRWRFADED